MNPEIAFERRLDEVEIRTSLAEDLVERLNDVIVTQQVQIDLLIREVRRLAERLDAGEAPPESRSLRDEVPPHY